MASALPTIPGTDVPARQPKAAQIRAIRARAKASEAIVNLLAELAYGHRLDDGWPPNLFGCTATAALQHHRDMQYQVPA